MVRQFEIQSAILSCLCDLSGLDAAGANFHPARTALRQGHPDRLQVRIEPARGAVVGMRNIITELR